MCFKNIYDISIILFTFDPLLKVMQISNGDKKIRFIQLSLGKL